MPSPAARALSLLQSILLSLGQSINHDNAIYISNYYINIVHLALIEIQDLINDISWLSEQKGIA
jgi:hypothetical protein